MYLSTVTHSSLVILNFEAKIFIFKANIYRFQILVSSITKGYKYECIYL